MTEAQWIAPQWQPQLEAAGLDSVADLLDHPPPALRLRGRWEALTKPGLGGRQRWRGVLDDGRVVVYVKRYPRPTLREQWDRLWRQSLRHGRAWWEASQCRRLAEAQIPAPQSIGVAERRSGPVELAGAVILSAAPGEALDRAWRAALDANAPITSGLARSDLIVRLARLISAFHQSGTCHRDLYLCHVFADLDFEGQRPPTFTLIDLARTLRPRVRRLRWILKDLAQLDSSARPLGASRSDRLRFLQTYLGLGHGAPRLRWYAQRVIRRSNRILRRSARQSRPQ